MTTPSSPEVPLAQLLSSSVARNRRNSGINLQYSLINTLLWNFAWGNLPTLLWNFALGEAPKFLGYEHFPNYKWGSRVGSGSLTPNGWGSKLGYGTLTPNGGEPPSRDNILLENQIHVVASLANSDHKSQNNDLVVDHSVSFEPFGEDIPTCIVRDPATTHQNASGDTQEAITEGTNMKDLMTKNEDSGKAQFNGETAYIKFLGCL